MEERVSVKEGVMIFSMLVIVMLGCTPSLARDTSCVRPPTQTTPCYKHYCMCSGNIANCSSNFGRLTFLPVLPKTVENVIFSYNNLTAIRHDFFENVSMIECLDLQYNGLEFISQGAFSVFTNLGILYLGYNRLSYHALTPIFDTKGLFRLYIGHMGLGPIPSGYFARRSLPSLARLDISGNNLQHLNLSELEPLTGLLQLHALECLITQVTSAPLKKLIFLDLALNALHDLPDSCFSNGSSSLFPMLRELRIEQNKVDDFHNQICLPKLKHLELTKNSITKLKTGMFNGTRFPKLEQLTLDSMTIKKIEAFAFRNPALQALSLMYCNMHLNVVASPDSFTGIPNLRFLQAGHNFATDLSEQTFHRLFGPLKSLQKLYLNSCGLSISRAMFANTTGLTSLYLYDNKLTAIPDGAFDSLINLEYLSLSDNQIQAVHEETFSPATRSRLRHLYLDGNPFLCDCDLLWFLGWFTSSPSVFSSTYGSYSCANIPDTPLRNFRQVEQACLLGRETSTAIIGSMVCFLIILNIVSVMYQYRWHIRLMLAFRGHGEIMRRRLQEENFTYDVFVSSAEEDEAWVLEELLPTLEGRLALRVCFHKRDFVLGKNILNNIVDSVKGSKKFLMVFSKDFAASRWCQFELDLCLGHVFDNDDDLIVTCLDDVASRDLTNTMTAVLRTTTYIQWPRDPGASVSFWRRLERALHLILP